MKIAAAVGALIGLALFAAVASAQPAPRFQLPKGFVVEQVAAPPLVRYPLFACFDDHGRLYVAEGTGTNLPGADLAKKPMGRILVLEDKDGDGKFDTSRVFADGLVFPQGVLWHDGSVYTASHPSFWKLTDTKGTGVADRREEIVTGFKFNGNGCDIHGPFLGPDGRLYWTDGRHGYDIKTRDGKRLEGLAARIWRCRTDGTDLERLCGGGFDNPVELAWTPDGEIIGTMDQGPGDCLLHFVEGGVYPMEHPCIKEFPWTGPLLGAVQRYSRELPAALCGTMRYRSAVFGPEFRDALITTHYMTHKLVRSKLIRDGATFRAEDTDFLVSADPNLRITDVLEDADGSVLFVDMGAWYTYGFLGNPIPRPEILGGIYRIRRTDAAAVPDPRGKDLGIDKASAADLIPFLDDSRPMVRDQVVTRLAKLGPDAVAALAECLNSTSRSALARKNAVLALCRMDDSAARAPIRQALTDRDADVRMAAVHAVGLHRDADATNALTGLIHKTEPPMRRRIAESLGRIGQSKAVPALLETLRRPNDAFLEHALIYALIQINDPQTTLQALGDSHARVRRAGLIALDQMKDGKLTPEQVVPLLGSDDGDLQQTALLVVSRRPEWAALAQGTMRKWLAGPRLTSDQHKTLNEVLVAGSADAAIQALVADALTDQRAPAATRQFLIGVVGQTRVEPLPKSWSSALEMSLADEAVLRETLAVIKTRKWKQFDARLEKLSRQPKQPADVRLAALECLSGRGPALDGETFSFLAGHLSEQSEPFLRLSAARTLSSAPLAAEQLIELAQQRTTVSTMVLRMLLPIFSKTKDARIGAALVESLERSKAAEALTVAELDQTLKEYPAAVRTKAEPLRSKLVARQKGQAAYLAGLTAELDTLSGDADIGKEIFLSPKHSCFACHRAVGRGGEIGPDLSKIGQFRTKAELLESIIFPSLIIAPEYRSHQIAMTDGKSVTGLIMRDAADALVLRMTDLAELRIARKDIEDVTPAAVSLMPDGLERTLSRQELRDLLEFLVQQKQPIEP